MISSPRDNLFVKLSPSRGYFETANEYKMSGRDWRIIGAVASECAVHLDNKHSLTKSNLEELKSAFPRWVVRLEAAIAKAVAAGCERDPFQDEKLLAVRNFLAYLDRSNVKALRVDIRFGGPGDL